MRAPTRPRPNETDAERTARLDRDAMRSYSTQRYGGGRLSKRYHQDMSDITNAAPAPQAPGPDSEK